jgi:hypothetical protein
METSGGDEGEVAGGLGVVVAADEEPGLPPGGDLAELALGLVVGERKAAVVKKPGERPLLAMGVSERRAKAGRSRALERRREVRARRPRRERAGGSVGDGAVVEARRRGSSAAFSTKTSPAVPSATDALRSSPASPTQTSSATSSTTSASRPAARHARPPPRAPPPSPPETIPFETNRDPLLPLRAEDQVPPPRLGVPRRRRGTPGRFAFTDSAWARASSPGSSSPGS